MDKAAESDAIIGNCWAFDLISEGDTGLDLHGNHGFGYLSTHGGCMEGDKE